MNEQFRAGMLQAVSMCEDEANSLDKTRRELPDDSPMVDRLDLASASNATRAMCIKILTACQTETTEQRDG